MESLSAYARQFLEMMQKPDVEHIDGLSPAISIEQKTTSRNPRSTVATVTEIYDYMRLLWARVGHALFACDRSADFCADRQPDGRPGDGPARRHTPLPACPGGLRGRKGEYRKELAEWQRVGFTRVRNRRGNVSDRGSPRRSTRSSSMTSEVVVDRIAVKDGIETRLADSFEQALKLAEGLAYVDLADGVVPGREA